MAKLYFYQLFEQYRDEGYSPDDAENLAWKMIQGNPDNWREEKTENTLIQENSNAETDSDEIQF